MLEQLKAEVCQANLDLVKEGLVTQTWGNVSGIDRERGLVAIKPSGVPYAQMKPEQMVILSLEDGAVVEGGMNPSSDAPTHLALYRAFQQIGGVAHTHSLYATAWAQARRAIPALGTTQADYWHGEIPCTRALEPGEIQHDYEHNTGLVIIESLRKLDPLHFPGVLVSSHGPFAWGRSANDSVQNAVVLEFVARLAVESLRLNPEIEQLDTVLLDKHFLRKHGPRAYYGQKPEA
jgi:L-ribulose-5-phosphate 4-epimerase